MANGPTVRRRRLGTELRRLRESSGYKLEEVAAQLGVAPSTLSRIETGKAPTKSAYLNQMLETYGVIDPGQRQVLVDMAREGHRKGWWAAYDDVLPSGFDIYVGLEAETAGIRSYEISVVHGLLQTADYARAVIRETFPRHTAEQVDRLVDLRMARQGRFEDDPPLELWAILDEGVIRRTVGGRSRSLSFRTGPIPKLSTWSPWQGFSTWRKTKRCEPGRRASTGSVPRRCRRARPRT